MALPLAMLAVGTGMQMYGADRKKRALSSAMGEDDARMRAYDSVFNPLDDAAQARLERETGGLNQMYGQSQDQLVQGYMPGQRMQSFEQGRQSTGGDLQAAIAEMNRRNPTQAASPEGGAGPNAAYAQVAGREQARVADRTGDLSATLMDAGGLEGMADYDQELNTDYSTRAASIGRGLTNALAIHQLGQAKRDQARNRLLGGSALERSRAMRRASTEGDGLMMAGGLMNVGAQGYGSWSANQPAQQQQGLGNAGGLDLMYRNPGLA